MMRVRARPRAPSRARGLGVTWKSRWTLLSEVWLVLAVS